MYRSQNYKLRDENGLETDQYITISGVGCNPNYNPNVIKPESVSYYILEI